MMEEVMKSSTVKFLLLCSFIDTDKGVRLK